MEEVFGNIQVYYIVFIFTGKKFKIYMLNKFFSKKLGFFRSSFDCPMSINLNTFGIKRNIISKNKKAKVVEVKKYLAKVI